MSKKIFFKKYEFVKDIKGYRLYVRFNNNTWSYRLVKVSVFEKDGFKSKEEATTNGEEQIQKLQEAIEELEGTVKNFFKNNK